MARFQVLVSTDRLTAEVKATAGPPATADDLQAALTEARIVHGIDDAALALLAARLGEGSWQGRAVVARGTPAVPGAIGRVETAFPSLPQPGRPGPDDAIDYRERGILRPAVTGTLLGRVLPPQPGTPGRDVHGAAIAAPPGKPASLRPGRGVARNERDELTATRDGVIAYVPGAIDVVPLWQHKGDVDLASGNLHTAGSLIVAGDIGEGALVDASGDVVVQGAVLDGQVLAGGNVVVAQSVQGMRALVEAGGDLMCRHATAATLRCGGTLRARDELTLCRARGASIELLGGRGAAVGGELRAMHSLVVQQAGTAGGAATLLAVADLADELTRELLGGNFSARTDRRPPRPAAGDRGTGDGRRGRSASAIADAAPSERLAIALAQRELLKTAVVEVRGECHPGVLIQFGNTTLTIQEHCQGVRCRWDSDREVIVQEPL